MALQDTGQGSFAQSASSARHIGAAIDQTWLFQNVIDSLGLDLPFPESPLEYILVSECPYPWHACAVTKVMTPPSPRVTIPYHSF